MIRVLAKRTQRIQNSPHDDLPLDLTAAHHLIHLFDLHIFDPTSADIIQRTALWPHPCVCDPVCLYAGLASSNLRAPLLLPFCHLASIEPSLASSKFPFLLTSNPLLARVQAYSVCIYALYWRTVELVWTCSHATSILFVIRSQCMQGTRIKLRTDPTSKIAINPIPIYLADQYERILGLDLDLHDLTRTEFHARRTQRKPASGQPSSRYSSYRQWKAQRSALVFREACPWGGP